MTVGESVNPLKLFGNSHKYLQYLHFSGGYLSFFSKKGYDFFLGFYLFIFRERGMEGEREGEKHQYVVASHASPLGT